MKSYYSKFWAFVLCLPNCLWSLLQLFHYSLNNCACLVYKFVIASSVTWGSCPMVHHLIFASTFVYTQYRLYNTIWTLWQFSLHFLLTTPVPKYRPEQWITNIIAMAYQQPEHPVPMIKCHSTQSICYPLKPCCTSFCQIYYKYNLTATLVWVWW